MPRAGRSAFTVTPPKPKPPEPEKEPEETPTPDKTPSKWKQISAGSKARLTKADLSSTVQEIHQRLEDNPRYRVSIQWTVEEEPE